MSLDTLLYSFTELMEKPKANSLSLGPLLYTSASCPEYRVRFRAVYRISIRVDRNDNATFINLQSNVFLIPPIYLILAEHLLFV